MGNGYYLYSSYARIKCLSETFSNKLINRILIFLFINYQVHLVIKLILSPKM